MEKQTEQKVLIFDRKTRQKISGPSELAYGSWIIKNNEKLNRLIKRKNI
jgi:hypothetical protein